MILLSRLRNNELARRARPTYTCAVNEIAGDADTKESFVRQDIPNGFRIVRDKQTVVDGKLSKHHGRQRE